MVWVLDLVIALYPGLVLYRWEIQSMVEVGHRTSRVQVDPELPYRVVVVARMVP